jgi:glycosyltransferase involved in cell wall biosynthesis
MPRIVHLGKFYPPAPGGIETHLQALASSQAKLGAEVRVLCVNHADEAGNDLTFCRFRRTPTVAENDGPVQVLRFGRIGSFARFDVCPTLMRCLGASIRGADVVHLHTPNPTMLIALAASRARHPVVVTHHSDVVRQRWLRHAVTPFERVVYGRAERILSDSPLYLEGSATLLRYRHKVVALPLGIDLAPWLEPSAAALEHARRLRAERSEPLWLMVGRLIYYKGIEVALRALRDVPGRLFLVGAGPLEGPMRRLAASLGVEDRVLWRGHAPRDELIGAYHAATALWFPSTARSEGFGLVQVEALASGCPVLNTSIPHSGVSWVSPHEQTGLTVPVNDSAALAGAAQRLLQEPGLRERLGRQGRERAVACFSQERMAQRSLEIYQSLLGRP